MTTLLLAEHDNESLKDATNKALTAAKQIGAERLGRSQRLVGRILERCVVVLGKKKRGHHGFR